MLATRSFGGLALCRIGQRRDRFDLLPDKIGERVIGMIPDTDDDAAGTELGIGAPGDGRARAAARYRGTQRDLNMNQLHFADLAVQHYAAGLLMHGFMPLIEDHAELHAVATACFDRLRRLSLRESQPLFHSARLPASVTAIACCACSPSGVAS